jgi:CO dehydrogenase maturation factor
MNNAGQELPIMKSIEKSLAGQRIGLFGRGGCGKSTITVFLAHALAEKGYPVSVLDADSTNEGLAEALGADHAPEPLLDWLGGTVFSGGPVTCPVDDPVPLAGARINLRELPSRYCRRAPDGAMVFQAGKIGPLGPGAGCDGPMTKIARDFKLETEGSQPVTLVDFKAGVEDASRGVITSLDWIVVVIDPSQAGVRAAITMQRLLEQMHAGHLPATRHLQSPELVRLTEDAYRNARTKGIVFVLNKVPDIETEHHLWQFLVQAGISAVASIPDDPDLREAWLEGAPLRSAAAGAEASKVVRNLERMAAEADAARGMPQSLSHA